MKKLLSELDIKHSIKSFIPSNQTYIDNDTLYYKSIPSALFCLKHVELTGRTIPDDGFKTKGTMVDLSRNAVFKVDYFKQVLYKKALLGFNVVWLYMEDVYTLEDYPKFGYLRGRYTLNQLKELDDYANYLGIELVPCIQTLGHMGQFLRWPSSAPFKDQSDVLMMRESIPLIHAMISFCKKAFRTTQIHVGMDETFGFGFGQHYKKYGYEDPESLFIEHLNTVNNICLNVGYKDVLIWSDMFFRHRSQTNYYYDTEITFDQAFIQKIPNNVGLVYWDYYNHKPDIYDKMLQKHLQMNRRVVMASGVWIWTKLAYDHEQTKRTAALAIDATKELGIKEIIFTQWQDDGAYVDYETSFHGLFDVTQWACEHKVSEDYLLYLTHNSLNNHLSISQVNRLGFDPVRLLWDDLCLGIYLNDLVGYDSSKLATYIRKTKHHIKNMRQIDAYHHRLIAEVLCVKLEIRVSILEGYFTTYDFSHTMVLLKRFKRLMSSLVNSFDEMWHNRYTPFGLEVLQTRLFAQIKRAEELAYWIHAYSNKEIDRIPFLEETLSKEPYIGVKHLELAFSSKQ